VGWLRDRLEYRFSNSALITRISVPVSTHTSIPAGQSWLWTLMAFAVAASLFGFQLIGAFADWVGMETPRPLSLALRIGSGLVMLLIIVNLSMRVPRNIAGVAFLLGSFFLLVYGFHLFFKTRFPDFPLRLPWFEYLGYFLFFNTIPFIASSLSCRGVFFERLFVQLAWITASVVGIYLAAYGVDAFRGMRYQPFASVNPVGVGYVGLWAATLMTWRLLFRRSRSSTPAVSVVALLILMGGLTLALLSAQRQVLLSLTVTFLLFLYLLPGKPGFLRHIRQGFFVFLLTLFIVVMAQIDGMENAYERVAGTAERIDVGEEGRLLMWIEAVHIIVESPILGGPIELPSNGIYPHNLLLEAFMASGVFGGCLLLAFFLLIAYVAFRILHSRRGWVAILHYQMAISALLSGALYSNEWYWISAGLVVAAAQLDHQRLATAAR
jgi:hypothetical protein